MRGRLGDYLQSIRYALRRHRAEVVLGLITLVFAALQWMFNLLPGYSDPLAVLFLGLIVLILLVLYTRLSLGQLFDSRFLRINHILIDLLGVAWYETQYSIRERHFFKEKRKLASVLVDEVLPRIVQQVCSETEDVDEIDLILDSGTTITPVFSYLLDSGVRPIPPGTRLCIFTNNLAGIDEIRKSDPRKRHRLGDRDFTVLPGRPLSKYRATTGPETNKFLEDQWQSRQNEVSRVIIGVLTANWFLVGHAWDEIRVCARGEGHLDFKKRVIDIADHIVLVAPLGKILPLDHAKQLNDLLPRGEDAYKTCELPVEKKQKTMLLASYRREDTLSPLKRGSMHLRALEDRQRKNFTLYVANPSYDPPGTKEEVRRVELPHGYMRRNFAKVFGEGDD